MGGESNIFGGKNKRSLYTPMSEDEQEVLARLIEADDLEIHVKRWGVIRKFLEKPRFGDKNIDFKFWVKFSKPDVLIPIHFFDLDLYTRSGQLLYAERQAIKGPDGGPLMVGAGMTVPLGWTIAIHQMDPRLVRGIKPGARGLTTREGNRNLTPEEQQVLSCVREHERRARQDTLDQASKATQRSLREED
jgi:hypothetical protein